MLVLGRTGGQWVEIVHVKSGDVLRIQVNRIRTEPERYGYCRLGFEDAPRNFQISRPEAKSKDASESPAAVAVP